MSMPESDARRTRLPRSRTSHPVGKPAASANGSAHAKPATIATTPAMEPQDGTCIAGPLSVATLRQIRQVNNSSLSPTVRAAGAALAPRGQLTGWAPQKRTQSPQPGFARRAGLLSGEVPNMRTYQLAGQLAGQLASQLAGQRAAQLAAAMAFVAAAGTAQAA